MKTDVKVDKDEVIGRDRNDTPYGAGDQMKALSIFDFTRTDCADEMSIEAIADHGDTDKDMNVKYALDSCFVNPKIDWKIKDNPKGKRREDAKAGAKRRTPDVSNTTKRRRSNAAILRRTSRAPTKASSPNRKGVTGSGRSREKGAASRFYEGGTRDVHLGGPRAERRSPKKEMFAWKPRSSSTE